MTSKINLYMRNYLLAFLLTTGVLFTVRAQEKPSEAELKTITYTSAFDNTARDFYLYLPKGYDETNDKKWPIMLFLHGNGERGNGKNELPYTLAHGPIYEAWIQKRDLPFIIIQPQLHMHGFDSVPNSYYNQRKLENHPKRLKVGTPNRSPKSKSDAPMGSLVTHPGYKYGTYGPPMGWETVETDLLKMLQTVGADYNTDASKVYLTGLSYGGFGTWYMASKHPDLFAAIAPIVGWGHSDLMAPIAKHKIPLWCFAGGRDHVITLNHFYSGMNTLEKLGHPDVRFTIESDMNHDVWTRVYAGDDIYNWLLKQQKQN
ncbi:prolyl oligopeptidase family serine peptidase [Tamlana sp. I1]|uniref:carboxylesterase family protein n=1 Tax=Tamlana sp. I1 TaxID=2762061 RepID=UPI001E59BEAF|nr:prolyl oligopeptidase family serine peptidase [Tamlana sp. I1]